MTSSDTAVVSSQTHKSAEMIPSSWVSHASQDAMWHLRMRNASQEHERVVGFFSIFSIDSVEVVLPNQKPEIKTSLTYRQPQPSM